MLHKGIEFLPSYLPVIYVSWTKEPKIKQSFVLVTACKGVGQVRAIRLGSRGRKTSFFAYLCGVAPTSPLPRCSPHTVSRRTGYLGRIKTRSFDGFGRVAELPQGGK